MTKRKKLFQLHQIDNCLKNKKIVLFFQYNNVNTRDWGLLRGELLSEVASCKGSPIPTSLLREPNGVSLGEAGSTNREVPISTLVVKSKIGQFYLAQRLATNPGSTLSRPRTPIKLVSETASSGEGSGNELPSRLGNSTRCAELFQGPTFLFACNSHREMVIGCKVISNKRDRHSNNHAILLGGIYFGKVATHLDIDKLSSLDSSVYAALPMALESKVAFLLIGGLSCHQDELLRCLEWRRDTLSRGSLEGVTE